MSTALPPESATGVGLGYGIAIAVSILVLISTIMLASYACVRVKASGRRHGGSDSGAGGGRRPNHQSTMSLGVLPEPVSRRGGVSCHALRNADNSGGPWAT
ncbi:hypothetical protein L1049_011528 [Liquidambar formosana]|uniref:Uncharacterized protein n=1 Tax=Liquidambar formosana TaxID=63359 RepID=A0AAP0RWJ9_LIQFO